ncbi:MAG: SIS domain-containing protein, partial [Chlamydiae bacterium]|nr:SIS domain-containing protein [Chlamydiota bacterium]
MTEGHAQITEQTDLLLSLFAESRGLINYFFDQIDPAQCHKILQLCLQCKGLIIFTGVGKSGFIAEKIAATLSSTGTRSLYLAPSNFLHGDIGILSEEDLVIFLSKSGESEELLDLLPFIQQRHTKVISWTSNAES